MTKVELSSAHPPTKKPSKYNCHRISKTDILHICSNKGSQKSLRKDCLQMVSYQKFRNYKVILQKLQSFLRNLINNLTVFSKYMRRPDIMKNSHNLCNNPSCLFYFGKFVFTFSIRIAFIYFFIFVLKSLCFVCRLSVAGVRAWSFGP